MRPRPVLALVVANLQRLSRDRVGLFFMVVMPFVTILFVGLAIGGTGDSRVPVQVVADDADPTAAAVIEQLRAGSSVEVERADDVEQLRADVRRGIVAAGLVMPPGATSYDLVLSQASGSGLAARSAIDVAIGRVAAEQEALRAARTAGATPEQAARYVENARAQGGEVEVRTVDDAAGTATGFAYTAPANLLLFTFINSMAVAAALVESKRLGMVRRAVAAPVRTSSVLLGEAVSRFVVALAQSALIVAVSSVLFGIDWGAPVVVAVVIGLFCLIATGAAMLVGALVENPAQAPMIGPLLGTVMGMLGGCLWPREVAGDALATAGYVVPHSWALDGLLAATRPGAGLGSVLPEIGVLAAMAAVVLGLAVVAFDRRALRTV